VSSEQTSCPRCHRLFVCKAAAIENCDCRQLSLSDELKAYIATKYTGCLCFHCLTALKEMTSAVNKENTSS